MADAGFGTNIDRDDDALRWALANNDVVSEPGDWSVRAVSGQRAVTVSPGQGQAAQITMPELIGAKTAQETLQLPFTGSMVHQGKLVCREIEWYGIDQDVPGESRFVVLDAGNSATAPVGPPLLETVEGFTRLPGQKYHVPLYFAAVNQTNNAVLLWDLRYFRGGAPRRRLQFTDSTSPAPGSTFRPNSYYRHTERGVQVPSGCTARVTVFARATVRTNNNTNVAGVLSLYVDGENVGEWRIHNNARAGDVFVSGHWDEELLPGEHKLQVAVHSDPLSGNSQLFNFESTITVAY